ncbi:MAG TPA: YraN family protein [Candidatus Omnitrophota bacterium]|nr:YraN family protein [Candidatus Omnitrophota bacterium]HPD85025.1 YraN family protein [Candidatus Omnitrophota bacterium]HRZ03883.1 YraN family protein [Candidatus Omnitrophota bacterium]
MTLKTLALGKRGEALAVTFLKKHGYRILEKNFKTPLGEIDIIALDGDTVCFIEVKTRTDETYGTPFEAVSKFKQRKLSQSALLYLKRKNLLDQKARFDIVAVAQGEDGEYQPGILKDAFELDSSYRY